MNVSRNGEVVISDNEEIEVEFRDYFTSLVGIVAPSEAEASNEQLLRHADHCDVDFLLQPFEAEEVLNFKVLLALDSQLQGYRL